MQFQGWGTSLAWWANIPYDPLTHNILSELIFSKSGLGLNIVRYNLGGGSHPQFPQTNMRTGGMVPCLKMDSYTPFNSSNDPFQISFLDKAVQFGVNHVELFANTPPWWMTTNNKTSGANHIGTTNLSADKYPDFAQFLVNSFYFLKQRITFENKHNIAFYLSPFNEPSNPFWYYNPNNNGSQEGCFFTVHSQNKILQFIKALDPYSEIVLSSPDEFTSGFALATYLLSPKNIIDKVNVHGYSLSYKNQDLYLDTNFIRRSLVKSVSPKPLWMSEFGMGGNDTLVTALKLARHIFRDLQTYSPQAWIYWQVVESSSSDGWGLIHIPFDRPTYQQISIRKQYWIMKHFTHTLQEHDTYHFLDNNNHVLNIVNNSTNKQAYIILNDTPNTLHFSPSPNTLGSPSTNVSHTSSFFITNSVINYSGSPICPIAFEPYSISSITFTF